MRHDGRYIRIESALGRALKAAAACLLVLILVSIGVGLVVLLNLP